MKFFITQAETTNGEGKGKVADSFACYDPAWRFKSHAGYKCTHVGVI